MFIDTHCHLTDRVATGDNVDAVISRAHDVGVGMIICPTADPADIPSAMALANSRDDVFCTIGIHPEYAGAPVEELLTDEILNHPRVLGIGEIGLDYHYGADNKLAQIDMFKRQLEIAKKHNLPVAIHTREAEQDTEEILKNDIRGVMHCFTSSWDLAKVMLDRGFYFSASGILTFKNAEDVRETFKKIPIDRIVIETDSPYCAPVPHRGKPCEPAFVIDTARVLADIRGLHLNDLESILAQNTANLYPKWHVN